MRGSTIIPLLLISFLAVTTTAAVAPGDHHGGDRKWLIEGSCRLISIFDGHVPKEYCIETLKNAPYDEKAKLSQRGLAWISADLLLKNVTTTKGKLELMAHTGAGQTDPKLRVVLQNCGSMYREASHRAEEALKLIEEKRYKEADYTVSMVQGDGSECESAFKKEEDAASPLTKENLDCQYLGAMTTLLIRFFDKSYTPWGVPILNPPV